MKIIIFFLLISVNANSQFSSIATSRQFDRALFYYIASQNAGDLQTSAQQQSIGAFFKDLRDKQILSKIKFVYFFFNGNAGSNAINANDTLMYRITWVNSPIHTDSSVLFNGTTQYGNTNLLASELDSASTFISVYTRNDINSGTAIGGGNFNGYFQIANKVATNTFLIRCSTPSTITQSSATNADGRGFFVANRINATQEQLAVDGSILATVSKNSKTTAGINQPIFIGALNNGGSTVSYSSQNITISIAGSGLTSQQITDLNYCVNQLLKGLNLYILK